MAFGGESPTSRRAPTPPARVPAGGGAVISSYAEAGEIRLPRLAQAAQAEARRGTVCAEGCGSPEAASRPSRRSHVSWSWWIRSEQQLPAELALIVAAATVRHVEVHPRRLQVRKEPQALDVVQALREIQESGQVP